MRGRDFLSRRNFDNAVGEWHALNAPRRIWVPHPFRVFRKGAGVDSDLSALLSEQFSTAHSNGTSKVIDTACTSCYPLPYLLALSPEVFAPPAPTLLVSLEVPNSSPDARRIFPYVREFALGLAFKTPSVFGP